MNPFTFQTTPNVLFEAGATGKIAEIVASYGAKRVMLVTDKGVRNAGLTRSAEDALTKAGVSLSVFEDVVADPPAQVIEAAAKRARSESVELVLSIGTTLGFLVMIFGPLTGAGLNPARALGPALVGKHFDGIGHFIWCFTVAPIVGAVLAALVYTFVFTTEGKKGVRGMEPVG